MRERKGEGAEVGVVAQGQARQAGGLCKAAREAAREIVGLQHKVLQERQRPQPSRDGAFKRIVGEVDQLQVGALLEGRREGSLEAVVRNVEESHEGAVAHFRDGPTQLIPLQEQAAPGGVTDALWWHLPVQPVVGQVQGLQSGAPQDPWNQNLRHVPCECVAAQVARQ